MAVLSGIVCWIWLLSGVARDARPDSGQYVISELAPVADQDLAGALTTMAGSNAFLAQFKQRATGCPQPLAWVSVARLTGQPPGTVRLQSGNYLSPVFDLSDAPVRVAIPYPAPYETGYGKLTAMDAGGSAVVSLLPAWRVSTQDGGATHGVTWHPAKRCMQPND